MKIHKFRFKITTGNDVRILTVGIQKDKINNKLNEVYIGVTYIGDTTLHTNHVNTYKFNSNIKTNYIIDYSFAYAITAVGDVFSEQQEDYRINGRLKSTKYSQYDCELPSELDNYQVTKALAKGYCRTICNTVISKLKDVKDKEIVIEEYILN